MTRYQIAGDHERTGNRCEDHPCNGESGCSREVIERGADMPGWTLEDLIQRTIDALKTFQD